MITVRRADERHLVQLDQIQVWHTFGPTAQADPSAEAPGILLAFDEARLPPGGALPRQPDWPAEILTIVDEGALAYEDSKGGSGVLRAGEVQRLTAGRGTHHTEANASRIDWAHLFQIWLRPAENGLQSIRQQKRFSAADRRKTPCAVASSDGRKGSLRLHQDVLVLSTILPEGHHMLHELHQGRSAWVHVVRGAARVGDVILSTGDGAGFSEERVVSLLPHEETEILLIDFAGPLPTLPPNPAKPASP
jgi:redox-sensitive bicupin YhaK (pirin superfamily)